MRNLWEKYKYGCLAAAIILAVLIAAFFSGGEIGDNSLGQTGAEPELTEMKPDVERNSDTGQMATRESTQETARKTTQEQTRSSTQELTQQPTSESTSSEQKETRSSTQKVTQTTVQPSTQKPTQTQTQIIKPTSRPTETITEKQTQQTCTISISCKTVLENMDQLEPGLRSIIPDDGWILKPVTVELKNGESAFDVLKRVCRERKIHLEFSETPGVNSAYIEGIYNLYEFDCGSLSGWLYTVNRKFLNCSCSLYQVKNGDVLAFQYTCKNGKDIGAEAVVK